MTGPVCPACGVAVVPGYVKCPKCHASLPYQRSKSISVGGTSVQTEPRKFPFGVLLAAGALVAIGAYWATQHARESAPATVPATVGPVPAAPTATPAPVAPSDPLAASAQPAKPANPDAIATVFERELQRQQLWSTVAVIGNHVDVRSSSCNAPAMAQALANASPRFKAAGIAKLRCLEPSGALIFERGL